MTIKRMVPQNGPVEVKEEIAEIIGGNLVSETGIRTLYSYRTLPNLTSIEATLTLFEAVMRQTPVLQGPFYDFIFDIRVKHDNSQTGLENAENTLIQMIRDSWSILAETDAQTYKDIFAYSPDQMPGAPTEVNAIRRGYMFIRAIPI